MTKARNEHARLDADMQTLTDPACDPDWTNRVEKLMEDIRHHMQQEETELFPEARRHLGENLSEMAVEMHARKNELSGTAGVG